MASRVDPPASVHDFEVCGLVTSDVGTENRAIHDALSRLLAAVNLEHLAIRMLPGRAMPHFSPGGNLLSTSFDNQDSSDIYLRHTEVSIYEYNLEWDRDEESRPFSGT